MAASIIALTFAAVLPRTGPDRGFDGTTLPAETAAPPGGIGSDRALLHFDVDLARLPATLGDRIATTEWVSGDGYERFAGLDADAKPIVTVYLAGGGTSGGETDGGETGDGKASSGDPSAGKTGDGKASSGDPSAGETGDGKTSSGYPGSGKTGDGKTAAAATANGWAAANDTGATRALRWHRDGVEGVSVLQWDDRDLLPEVAGAVRLDAVQRCVIPLRLSELPPGAEWSECQTMIHRGDPGPATVWVYSGLTIRRADGNTVLIWADGRPLPSRSFAADRTVAGRPAQWRSGTGQFENGLWIADFGGIDLYVTDYETKPAGWFTPEEASWYTARLTPSADLDAPSSWPRRAVG